MMMMYVVSVRKMWSQENPKCVSCALSQVVDTTLKAQAQVQVHAPVDGQHWTITGTSVL